MWQLEGFDAAAFVAEYWQKKPCLLRAAFPGFKSPVSPEELAGLACEEDVHARLVLESDREPRWQLRYGPFEDADFTALPRSHYSLLVSECEKWIPELTQLLDQFRFVPDWRIDDLMISYAAPQGSVGPHVDEYDVFLLQAYGTRRWLYAETRLEQAKLLPDIELAILESFRADQEVVLQPGDMLYLPPGYAHHGIAQDACMTYSVGFRAPAAASVLESFALEADRNARRPQRYRDPDLEMERHPAELTAVEIERFRKLALDLLDAPTECWADAIGKLLSDSTVIGSGDDGQPLFVSDLQQGEWIRHPETRLLYHAGNEVIRMYFNGRVSQLSNNGETLGLVRRLCDQRELDSELIETCLRNRETEHLLLELAMHNAIIKLET